MYDTMMQTTIVQPTTKSSTRSAHVGAQLSQAREADVAVIRVFL